MALFGIYITPEMEEKLKGKVGKTKADKVFLILKEVLFKEE